MSDPTFTKIPSEADGAALLARSFLYQMMSFLFRHPGQEAVWLYLEAQRNTWRPACRAVTGRGGERLEGLCHGIYQELGTIGRSRWIAEYERCFGHTANAGVPAYELEYGEEHSFREPRELADIAAFYCAFGLRVSAGVHERVDHISVESEFMYFLIAKEIYAHLEGRPEEAAVTRQASRRFLADHLGRWTPSFALNLGRFAGAGLMKGAADLAFEWVTRDCASEGLQAGRPDLVLRRVEETERTGCIACPMGPSAALQEGTLL